MISKFIRILVLLLPIYCLAQNPYAELIHEEIFNISNTARTNTFASDFNQNGDIEIAYSTGNSNKTFLKFLNAEGNQYTEFKNVVPATSEIKWMEYSESENLIYIAEGKSIISYNPINEEVKLIYEAFSGSFEKFKIHETDTTTYFIIRSWNNLILINQAGDWLQEQSFNNMKDFAVGNVDEELDPEIIISIGASSKVIDLLSFDVEWEYFSDFGESITLGDLDGDGVSFIYGVNYNEIKCFDISLQKLVWSVDENFSASEILFVPSSTSGEAVLIVSRNNSKISAINPNNGLQLWEVPTPHFSNYGFIFEDLDNDDDRDLFYASGNRQIVVRDIEQTTQWVSTSYESRMFIDLLDKNDGDIVNYVTCSGSSESSSRAELTIRSGGNDSVLVGPIILENFQDIEELASIHIGNDSYYLVKENNGKIFLYKNSFTQVYALFNDFNSDLSDIQLIQLEESGPPFIVGIEKDKQFAIYSTTSNKINLKWKSTSTTSSYKAHKIGNFDADESLEVAILYNTVIVMYDLDSKALENQTFINVDSDHNALDVADFDQDGKLDYIIGGTANSNKTDIQVIDIESGDIEEHVLFENSKNLRILKLANLDTTERSELVVLADKFYVYDLLDQSIIFEYDAYPLEVSNTTIDLNDIEIIDLDIDKHMDVLIAHQFGFSRFRIESEFIDIKLPFVREFKPNANQQNLPTNVTIRVDFSEEVDENTLSNIIIQDQSGTDLAFTAKISTEPKRVELEPISNWTANGTITITLPNTITDLSGNKLDGNKNGVEDIPEIDKYVFQLNMGSGIDNILPYFKNISSESDIFSGQILNITGKASDENTNVVSNIKKILYLLDDPNVIKNGIPIASLDGIYDSSEENFKITLSSAPLDFGLHTVYFLTQDVSENWSLPDSIQFSINQEPESNWNLHGKDLFNTSYAPSSKFSSPVKLKYEIDNNINSFDALSRSIVVGDHFIYSSDSRIWVRDIETGAVIWTKTYVNSNQLSTPAYAYGNIYLQVGDHSDSELVCLALTDGELIWSTPYSVQWMDITGPVVDDNKVLIVEGYDDTTIGAYDAFNGNVLWKTEFSQNNFDDWNPAIYDGKVYGVSDHISVMELETGVEIINLTDDDFPFNWSGFITDGSPVIDTTNNQLIVTSLFFLFSLDLDTYETNWNISSIDFGYFTSTPALAGNSLFVGNEERIMELDASNGQVLWSNTDFTGQYDPVVSDSIIAFSTNEYVVLVDINSKEIASRFRNGGNLTLSENYLIVSEANGNQTFLLEKSDSLTSLTSEIVVVDSISCFGGQNGSIEMIVNGGSGSLEFVWNDDPINSKTRTGLAAGDYSVIVYDDFFNQSESSITLTQPDELILTTSSTDEINGGGDGSASVIPTGGTAPYTYSWNDFPGVSLPTLPNLNAGNYIVYVTDARGCEAVTTVIVYATTGTVENEFNYLKLYPTISTGLFTLEVSDNWIGSEYSIFSTSGLELSQGIINQNELYFEENNMSNGTYFISLKNDTNQTTLRFVVLK